MKIPFAFALLAAAVLSPTPVAAQTLTLGKISSFSITPGFEGPLFWDTDPFTAFTYLGLKQNGVFIEPTGTANISVPLTINGDHVFEMRLERGVHRDMASYQFELFFNSHSGAPDISATAAPTALASQSNPFSGTLSTFQSGKYLDLIALGITLEHPADDQVNEGAAMPDNVVDYVGHFTVRVGDTPLPEPTTAVLALLGIGSLLARRRLR